MKLRAYFFLLSLMLSFASSRASVFSLKDTHRLKANATGEFEVCWWGDFDRPQGGLKEDLQNYIQSEFEGRAGIKLRFFSDCFEHSNPFFPIGIAIYTDPSLKMGLRNVMHSLVKDTDPSPGHPNAFFSGKWAQDQLIDVLLNHLFVDVNESLKLQSAAFTGKGRENLIRSIAVHELMHAFGFAHEHRHRDSDCQIEGEVYRSSLHQLLTSYDRDSVMNYCLTHFYDFEKGPLGLSGLDIEGLRQKYIHNP